MRKKITIVMVRRGRMCRIFWNFVQDRGKLDFMIVQQCLILCSVGVWDNTIPACFSTLSIWICFSCLVV
jgi:hypothetical protein